MRIQEKTTKIILASTLICLNLTADAGRLYDDGDYPVTKPAHHASAIYYPRTCGDALRDATVQTGRHIYRDAGIAAREIAEKFQDMGYFLRYGTLEPGAAERAALRQGVQAISGNIGVRIFDALLNLARTR